MKVARIAMPETSIYSLRLDDPSAAETGANAVASFLWGEDMGVICGLDEIPGDGPESPSFRFLRMAGEADERRSRENVRLSEAMAARFSREIGQGGAAYSRLSLGRNCLFIIPGGEAARPDLKRAGDVVRKLFGVDVKILPRTFLRKPPPREVFAARGALGMCGRACCCASWKCRLPLEDRPSRQTGCGTCGRRKCCEDFE